ncbi:MAG: metalloregulator ArsR/SmtB family transcription factor [Chitinispirillaceae bacterium]|nr:metalloregulator ArsR/SmtB family transcription factor [Chitinispirillaceae bacterium]
MRKEKLAKYMLRAEVIKAMAHPTRLLIIEELSGAEKCVCELTELIGSDISTVSKHLRILKNVGIVSDEKKGQMVYYKLAMPCILKLLSCLESVLEERCRVQSDLLKK